MNSEIAALIVDGTLCVRCGGAVTDPPCPCGYMRRCQECSGEHSDEWRYEIRDG